MHKPESVWENETHKILFFYYFFFQTQEAKLNELNSREMIYTLHIVLPGLFRRDSKIDPGDIKCLFVTKTPAAISLNQQLQLI